MSARSNPFEEIERLFERMTRQFDEAARMWDVDGPRGWWPTETEAMAVDLVEHDDEFVVTVDLPGFEREEVEVRVADQTVRITAEHEESTEQGAEQYLRQERRHETLQRSIRLPDAVDADAVSARMKHGVLTVTLPRLESGTTREIDIE